MVRILLKWENANNIVFSGNTFMQCYIIGYKSSFVIVNKRLEGNILKC